MARSMVNFRGGGSARSGKAKLGQNFLADRAAAERIVESLGDLAGRVVVEIGPGHGALTGTLVGKAGQVIAIELDHRLAAELRLRFAASANLEVLEGDVLNVDFRTVLRRPASPLTGLQAVHPARAHVIGNLPYYITSDILLRLFEYHGLFDLIVIMVQREVADRIVARPGTRDYGLLSATAQLYTQPERLFTLPPGAFSPPPKVHSSVLRMKVEPRFQELGVPPDQFIGFLKLAFAMKRKTLLNNLRKNYPEDRVKNALREAAVRPDVRAEALPLETSAQIFRNLAAAQ